MPHWILYATFAWDFIAVLLLYVMLRAHGRTFQRALHLGAQVGFDVGYLRALNDDDTRRREVVAAIKRKEETPSFIKSFDIKF